MPSKHHIHVLVNLPDTSFIMINEVAQLTYALAYDFNLLTLLLLDSIYFMTARIVYRCNRYIFANEPRQEWKD